MQHHRPRSLPLERLARRGRARGAALIEALIVISFLILGFIGLVFFRELYLKQMRASRLARASLIAYAITGCRSNTNEPPQWIGRQDMGGLNSTSPNTNNTPATPTNRPAQPTPPAEPQSKSGSILSKVGGTTGGGDGLLNPVAVTDLSGRVSTQTRSGTLAETRARFQANARSRSFSSCADPVRRSFEDAVDYIIGDFP